MLTHMTTMLCVGSLQHWISLIFPDHSLFFDHPYTRACKMTLSTVHDGNLNHEVETLETLFPIYISTTTPITNQLRARTSKSLVGLE